MLTLYAYKFTIIRVIDGDTILGILDKGRKEFQEVSLRLSDINAPELKSKDPEERKKAELARDFLVQLLGDQKTIYVQTTATWDKYGGRVDAHAWLTKDNNKKSINTLIQEAGHAVAVNW